MNSSNEYLNGIIESLNNLVDDKKTVHTLSAVKDGDDENVKVFEISFLKTKIILTEFQNDSNNNIENYTIDLTYIDETLPDSFDVQKTHETTFNQLKELTKNIDNEIKNRYVSPEDKNLKDIDDRLKKLVEKKKKKENSKK